MSYRHIVSFRVGDQMRSDLERLAASRDTDVGKLLRMLVRRELAGGPDRDREQREQLLFLAIAIDGLLGVHPSPDLREKIIGQWRERLSEEARRDVA